MRKEPVADYILAILFHAVEDVFHTAEAIVGKSTLCLFAGILGARMARVTYEETQRSFMPEPSSDAAPKIPLPISKELRTLAHDLSNSIETIMQACYLLSQAKLDDANKKWLDLIDQATRDAARINRELREVLRNQSQEP